MKLKLIILLLFSSSIISFSQSDLRLSDAIQRGLNNNYQIKITYNNQDISKKNNTWGNAGALPILNLSANPGYSVRDENAEFTYKDGSGKDVTKDTTNTTKMFDAGVTLSLNWTLFDGFRMFINKDKFNLMENLSRGNTRFLVENTIQSIILAYNRVLLEKQKLEVYERTTKLSKDRLDYEKTKQDLGTSTSYNFLQSKINYLTDKSNQLNQEQTYKASLRDLNFVIGEKDSVFVPIDELTAPIIDYNLGELITKMQSNNIDLKNQFLNIKIKEQDEKLAESRYYPTVALTGQTSYGINQTTFNDFEQPNKTSLYYKVGLSINYNIFNGFTDETRVAIAKVNKEIENIKLSKIEHELNNKLLKNYEQYSLRKEMYELSKNRVEATELNLELSRERYNRGAINSFNFRDVQLMHMNSAIAELQAIYNLISANVEILKITGSIVAEN
jgi:outer membrane protein TolC